MVILVLSNTPKSRSFGRGATQAQISHCDPEFSGRVLGGDVAISPLKSNIKLNFVIKVIFAKALYSVLNYFQNKN